VLFFWAPLVGRWERAEAELQDLACDRAVLRQRWVSARDYGRCLLWAAEAARASATPGSHAGLARGMASGAAGTLKRRILMMQQSTGGSRRMNLVAAALGLVAVASVAGTAWAVQAAVAERRVTQQQIAAVASRIQQRSGFPVLADQRIVQAFNKRLANPDWREYVR
jgi:beta-lactamase regulating signal transducer with metallopeptidase domain